MALLNLRHLEADLLERRRDAFTQTLSANGWPVLTRPRVTTLQINVGKRCNQACHHCHVEAGPNRTEDMSRETAERAMALLDATPSATTVDVTGGAPELNASFRYLVAESRRRGRHVIVRHNLTIQYEPGMEDLVAFFQRHEVEVVASLPCYSAANVDRQRGGGVFDKSIGALLALNAAGFGVPGSGLALNLVYNPGGPFLPPAQPALEARYKAELREHFGISFSGLFTITNMPIKRFAWDLERSGRYEEYMELLTDSFNHTTVDDLMCRSLVSVGWDGAVYDCDFNQMLEIPVAASSGAPERRTIWDLESYADLADVAIATAAHCYGCTAGAGSSCGGALG